MKKKVILGGIVCSIVCLLGLLAVNGFFSTPTSENDSNPCVLFTGPLGAGKTTTILYLLGKKLVLTNKEDNLEVTDYEIDLADTKDDSFGSIEHGVVPGTTFPTFYEGEQKKLTYCDLPGFTFQRGSPEGMHIISPPGMQTALAKLNEVKAIVFVISWPSFKRAYGADFHKTLRMLYHMFKNFKQDKEQIMPSIFFAFTKTNYTGPKILLRILGDYKKAIKSKISKISKKNKENYTDTLTEIKELNKILEVYEYITQEKYQDHLFLLHPLDEGEAREAMLRKIEQANPIPKHLLSLVSNEK